jgi:hypothetical protein
MKKIKPATTPCASNPALRKLILEYSESLKAEAHKIGSHGLSEEDFYNSGLFRGAIERVRGQFAATMAEKRTFISTVLNHLKSIGAIADWRSAGEDNRHDYQITLLDERLCVIELKGCLDGNNTNIFDRPPNANEFVIWSVCQNPGADPRHNVWSGIHTRLSAEIIDRQQQVDGLIVWDMVCGTTGRPCPKIVDGGTTPTTLDDYELPPPCIYLFPSTIPSPRLNKAPKPHSLKDVGFLNVLKDVFGGHDDELTYVHIETENMGTGDTARTTRLVRGGNVIAESEPTPIKRS